MLCNATCLSSRAFLLAATACLRHDLPSKNQIAPPHMAHAEAGWQRESSQAFPPLMDFREGVFSSDLVFAYSKMKEGERFSSKTSSSVGTSLGRLHSETINFSYQIQRL
jgi:hypothetical protein